MPANDNYKNWRSSVEELPGARFVSDDSYAGMMFFREELPTPTKASSLHPQTGTQPAARPGNKPLSEPYDYYPH